MRFRDFRGCAVASMLASCCAISSCEKATPPSEKPVSQTTGSAAPDDMPALGAAEPPVVVSSQGTAGKAGLPNDQPGDKDSRPTQAAVSVKPEPTYEVVTNWGETYVVTQPSIRYFYRTGGYYYTPGGRHAECKTKPSHVFLRQGWLRFEMPLDRIATIRKLDPNEERKFRFGGENETSLNTKSIMCDRAVSLNLPNTSLFEVVFADGNRTIACLNGTFDGTAKSGSLGGKYSVELKDVARLAMQGGGAADVSLLSGALQRGVSGITHRVPGDFDEEEDASANTLSLVVEAPGEQGGVAIVLEPSAFAGRTLVLTNSGLTKTGRGVFEVVGLAKEPLACEIAWMDGTEELYRRGLRCVEVSGTIGGVAATCLIPSENIQSMTIVAGKKTEVTALRLRGESADFEISDIHGVAFWRARMAGRDNASRKVDKLEFNIGELETDVNVSDLRGLLADANGNTTVLLNNDESHVGVLSHAEQLGVVGEMAERYGGLRPKACFRLSDVVSLRVLYK